MSTLTVPAAGTDRPRVPQPVLSCDGLRRTYGDLVAVDDVSFEIASGETFGLLGPNGAGKTTVISMVAGVLKIDSGVVAVDGQPMSPRAVKAKAAIGYVPQDVAVYPDLTGRENLRFFARLYGMRRAAVKERIEEVLHTIGLADRGNDLVSTYSGGMKRRLNIAAGLLHRPKLLILDEPTVGVDPQSRNAILASVEQLAAEGLAVLYTTHYMEEAQRLCDRVAIIDGGRLIAQGTVRELTALVGERDRVSLRAQAGAEEIGQRLRGLPGVEALSVSGQEITLVVHDAATALPALIREAGPAIRSVAVDEPDLEAVFLHLTGKKLRD
jgi:ABC-2 type transport system ATP-binding protein